MSYEAQITRANPSCFVFLIDQSGSMDEQLPEGVTKAQGVADATNRILSNLVIKCTGADEVRNYFYLGLVGYGGSVSTGFGGALSGLDLVPISSVADNPARLEDRVRKVSDGVGGLTEQTVKFPVWVEAVASGGTPMCQAVGEAERLVSNFLAEHPDCFPPIVINITDGAATDGDPSNPAKSLTSLASSDGNILMFNLHLSSSPAPPIEYPTHDESLPDQYARTLFGMSSVLPSKILGRATQIGYELSEGARGFAFNAKFESLVKFLEIGTIAADR